MQKNPLYNTSSISFFQYLFAIAVILVHSGRLTSYEPLHFGLKSILGRLAVPFFIICASFFLKQSLKDARKMKAYLVKIVKNYLFWSFATVKRYSTSYQAWMSTDRMPYAFVPGADAIRRATSRCIIPVQQGISSL